MNQSHADRTQEHLEKAARWARFLDSRFRIPGTGIAYGFDTLIGLIPGLGDAATTGMACVPIYHAWKAGASRSLLLRMAANVGIDTAIGTVPLVGDIADIFMRCNRRNAELLRKAIADNQISEPAAAANAAPISTKYVRVTR